MTPAQPLARDSQNMAASIMAFPKQCAQALRETAGLTVPPRYREARSIVVSGMGGSGLGAHVVASLCRDQLRVPFTISTQYNLPGWVDDSTLVVLSSYSGGTAETLAAAEEATRRGAMIMGITAGGPLLELLQKGSYPHYKIVPDHNPCGQPRMALGYGLLGLLGLLWPTGLIAGEGRAEAESVIGLALEREKSAGAFAPPEPALVREQLLGRSLIVIGSEHLEGNAHIFANQVNENAKRQATWYSLPEMNHHLLEGLLYPEELRAKTAFFFLESERYSEANRARYEVLSDILGDLEIYSVSASFNDTSPLAEVLAAASIGSWFSYWLAMAQDLDPSPIPYVDRFKAELKAKGF